MVIIKKLLSVMLAIVVIASVFAGCAKPVNSSEASPFSIYRIKDGVRISIGDKRENIEKVMETHLDIIVEFEDETPDDKVFEQYTYEDVAFDYTRSGTLLGIDARTSDWKIANGLKVTDSAEDVKRNYPEEYLHTYRQSADFYYSLDDNGNVIEFSEEAPYILRFVIEKHAVSRIIIKKNVK